MILWFVPNLSETFVFWNDDRGLELWISKLIAIANLIYITLPKTSAIIPPKFDGSVTRTDTLCKVFHLKVYCSCVQIIGYLIWIQFDSFLIIW